MSVQFVCLAPRPHNAGRSCWKFTRQHAKAFNEGHAYLINKTQDFVARLGGPVVDGPYSRWAVPACDFEELRGVVERGRKGIGPYVIEASHGACNPDDSCLAAFLMAAQEYTYLACVSLSCHTPCRPLRDMACTSLTLDRTFPGGFGSSSRGWLG